MPLIRLHRLAVTSGGGRDSVAASMGALTGDGTAPGRTTASSRGSSDDVVPDTAVVLDLVDAACATGLAVPGALAAVGQAIGGRHGQVLTQAAGALALGAPWTEAWPDEHAFVTLGDALRPTWDDGVPASGALRAAAATVRRRRGAAAVVAAEKLGVRLVLPLGLCYLPAFVLVGLLPVLISVAGTSLR